MKGNIKVHVFFCGELKIERAMLFRNAPADPEYKFIWIPIAVFLIEHPKGAVLIDTGWHVDARKDPLGYLSKLPTLTKDLRLPEGQAVHEQLAARRIQPSDLRYVVLTHLHSDHVSGLRQVKDAQEILVSDLDWQASQTSPYHPQRLLEGIDMKTYSYSPSEYGPVGAAHDLFGDGSVLLVHTPGHTPGLCTVLIKANGRHVLLVSDAAYSTRAIYEESLPGICVDEELAAASLCWIKEMASRPDCAGLFVVHDVGVPPQTIIM